MSFLEQQAHKMRPKEPSALCPNSIVSIEEVLEVETSSVKLTPVTSTVDMMELCTFLPDLILRTPFIVFPELGLKCCT